MTGSKEQKNPMTCVTVSLCDLSCVITNAKCLYFLKKKFLQIAVQVKSAIRYINHDFRIYV